MAMDLSCLFQTFSDIFGGEDTPKAFFAPGRVNLIGEHTDYNGGHVFPCALTMGTYGLIRKREDRLFRLYSMNFENAGITEVALDDITPDQKDGWADYPKGIIWTLHHNGYPLSGGADMLFYGDIPFGSGLSSSASLEVLTGIMLRDTFGFDLSMTALARIGQYSENNFNGCNCGIMDQFASAMGKTDHAIFLDTNTLAYEYAPVKLDGIKIVITNSNVKHSLVGSEYNVRRSQCETALKDLQEVCDIPSLGALTTEMFDFLAPSIKDPINRTRAKHAVYENQRTILAVEALKNGDLETFGKLMNASHVSLRDDYEVSCKEMDILTEEAWKLDGVIGSRMTGGGFGGCTVSLVREDMVEAFKTTVGNAYTKQTGLTADFYVVDIGNGASAL